MKRIIFILFYFTFCINLLSQVKKPRNLRFSDYRRFHFGFTIGAHSQDMAITRSENSIFFADVSDPGIGFQVSIISDVRIADNLNLRFLPGITLGEKPLSFYDASSGEPVASAVIESNFLDFPLLLKYSSVRLNNSRPYLLGGINYRYDLAAKKDFGEDEIIFIRLKPSDLYLEAGFGIDFYMRYARLSPEIKVGMGLNNLLVDKVPEGKAEFANSIKGLRSFVVMINLHIQD